MLFEICGDRAQSFLRIEKIELILYNEKNEKKIILFINNGIILQNKALSYKMK